MGEKSKLTFLGLAFTIIGAIASIGGSYASERKANLALDEKVAKEVSKQLKKEA